MVIGIDAAFANLAERTGVEHYALQVIRHLGAIDRATPYRLYLQGPLRADFGALPDNFEPVALKKQGSWAHMTLAAELARRPVAVFYSPAFVLPIRSAPARVFTVHDIAFRRFRDNYPLKQYLHLALNSALSARLATRIVTPSETVREDVIAHYRVAPEKVRAVASGVDPAIDVRASDAEIAAVKAKAGIAGRYLLFVGRVDRRKNVARMLEAFVRVKETGAFDGDFLVVGRDGPGSDEVAEIAAARLDVRRLGYVSEIEKRALLQGATALAFASLYEGFGLPILEGFAAGVPVITSRDAGACAEVAGDAAILVDPRDPADIAAGMARIVADRTLAAALVASGRRRLEAFSWTRTTQEIHALLMAEMARGRSAP